jgi:hypothetical protein
MVTIGQLRVRLVLSAPPLDGLRWKIGIKVLGLVVWLFGMKLVVGIEPDFVIGTLEPADA